MKYIIRIMAAVILPLIACEAFANSYMGQGKGECYFGADVQYVFIKPKPEYQDFFKSQHPGADIYLGYRFNRNLSLEFGYSWTTRDSKETEFAVGQKTLGGALTVDQATTSTSKVRYRNTHFDLNGYYRITKKIDGIISLGVGFLRPHTTIKLSNTAANLNAEVSTMKCKTTPVIRAGIGFENLVDKYWGLRIMLRYENTGRVNVRDAGVGGNKIWKNGSSVAVGFYRYLD